MTITVLIVWLALVPAHAGDDVRTAQYTGTAAFSSLCFERYPEVPITGGACFFGVAGAASVDVEVTDDLLAAPMGFLVFEEDLADGRQASVPFCHGSIRNVPVPEWTNVILVTIGQGQFATGEPRLEWIDEATACTGEHAGQGTTGTIALTLHR